LLADGQASLTYLADEIGLAGEQFDDLLLAKAKFPQPILNLGSGAQLLNPNGDTRFDST
jgi:hypothetical protein